MKAIGFALLLCAAGYCSGAEPASRDTAVLGGDRPRNVAELLGSADNLAIVRDATVVRVCSVKASPAGRKAPDVYRAADRGEFVALDSEHAATLKRLLLDGHSYAWSGLISLCLPNYTIRAEFKAGGKIVAANFCFGCSNLLFSKSSKSLGDQDLTAGAADELLRFFQQVFPNDPILLELAHRKEPAPQG